MKPPHHSSLPCPKQEPELLVWSIHVWIALLHTVQVANSLMWSYSSLEHQSQAPIDLLIQWGSSPGFHHDTGTLLPWSTKCCFC